MRILSAALALVLFALFALAAHALPVVALTLCAMGVIIAVFVLFAPADEPLIRHPSNRARLSKSTHEEQ